MGYAMLYNVNQFDLSPSLYEKLMCCRPGEMTVALDLETTGLNPQENCVEICSLHVPGSPTEIVMCHGSRVQRLREALALSKATFIMHYAPFDLSFLFSCFSCLPENVICTK